MDRPATPADHDELLAQLGWMRTLARRLARDPDVADDVLQRACVLALQRPAGVASGGAGLRAWLSAVLRRVAGHRRREDARRTRREQVAAVHEALPATIDLAARREILRKLVEALTTLDEPGFSTLVRRYYDGLSTLQIATQDGVSPEVVRQRLQRARAKLRERLESMLDARWLPALALLSPRPAGTAPLTLSRLVKRGLIMAETTARPFAWKAAAAAIAVVLGAGAWYALDDAAADEPAGPAALVPAAPLPSRAEPVLPALPPAHAEPAPVQPVSVAPAATTAAPAPAVAAVSPSAAWSRLWVTTDAVMQGTARFDDVLDTTEMLLDLAQAELAAQGATTLAEARSPLVLLDQEGVGRATLFAEKYEREGQPPSQGYRFAIQLDTADGRYSGLQQGQDDSTNLAISFGLDTDGHLTNCGTVVQNMPAQTAELHSHMAGRGPQPIGGVLSVKGGTSEWMPLTCEARTVDPQTGEPLDDLSFHHTTGPAEPRDGSVADPRAAAITQRLVALGPAKP
jgi:RNA polymerase sigma factor (sigma-70 family)